MKARNTLRNGDVINVAPVRATVRIAKDRHRATPYPAGSIGADLAKRNYVNYLVERYHRCREVEIAFGRTQRLRYGLLFKNIETKFKAPTYFVPDSRFGELVDYLYARIDKTILGRRNNSQGIRNFQSFDEFKMQQMSE